MRIEDLYGRRKGQTAYVVGTGASLRCLDLGFFRDKFVVGLNQAWKHVACNYVVTVHPELLDEFEKNPPADPREPLPPCWVVKKKPPREKLTLDDPRYYVFGTSYDVKAVVERPRDTLFLGEGVQTTAMDFAARLGASTIVLVGCDAARLGGDYHAHDQHVRWVGRTPDAQYKLYRDSTAAVRAALRPLGVSVMTLSPFIGADAAQEDYRRLREELNLAPLPEPRDISPKDWKPPKR